MIADQKAYGFDRAVLPNGLTIIGERLPHFRSVTVGVWVGVGSADEQPSDNGYAHFVEHMVFKGTLNRTARQIAQEMDAIGGQSNAFTSKECTCFYAKVMDKHLNKAMELLADLMLRPTFHPGDLEREKGVILEEIAMEEDTPEDLVHDLLSLALYGPNALGQSILGTQENIRGATSQGLRDFMCQRYVPGNAVLALAGNYDWEETLRMAQRHFGLWTGQRPEASQQRPSYLAKRQIRRKEIEQAHLCVAYPYMAASDPDRYAGAVLNNLLGGAMSSRLFQTIREERGLAYSVYSYPTLYRSSGYLTLYAGASPDNAQQVVDLMGKELRRLLREGVGKEEMEQSREQIKGSYILGMESTASRMNAIGRGQLLLGEVKTEAQYLSSLDQVRLEDMERLARQIFTQPFAAAVVGGTVPDFQSMEVG